MSDLKTLLETKPETLAVTQYQALKDHVLNQLKYTILKLQNNELDELEKLTFHSPAGDGYGSDNTCIDFCPPGMNVMDFGDVLGRLTSLREVFQPSTRRKK